MVIFGICFCFLVRKIDEMKQNEVHWWAVRDLIAMATTSASVITASVVATTSVQGQVTTTTLAAATVVPTTSVQRHITVTTSTTLGGVVMTSVQAPTSSTGTTSSRVDVEQSKEQKR